jgi:uridylate kinase
VTFKRILLKLSGEALQGPREFGIDLAVIRVLAEQIKQARALGPDVGVVVGGGNYLRGSEMSEAGMDRAQADYMGMLGTVMNGMAVQDALEKLEVPTRLQTAIPMQSVAEPFIRRRAIRHLEKGRVVIFAAGTGNPFVTTDTAGALRAMETDADALVMLKNKVDGVYSADPRKVPSATKLDRLTYHQAINMETVGIDSTAITMCRDNRMPIIVIRSPESPQDTDLVRLIRGETIGTLISE